MRAVRGWLLAMAIIQIASTLIGFFQLLLVPHWYEPMLADTIFADQFLLAALLLGVVVGGFQWAAAILHLRRSPWTLLGHTVAGMVMIGWIAGECLVLNSFIWPHALWGGLGVTQLLLVLVHLGVLKPMPVSPRPKG